MSDDVDPALADVPLPGEHHHSPIQLATGEERPSLLEAMGGPLGMAESAIPSVVFIIAITVGLELREAAISAVAVSVVLGIARLLRRQTIQFALAGVVGVGVSALIAYKTGEAKNFFVPSFFVNVAYGAVAFGSVVAKHPFVGHLVDGFGQGDGTWRQNPVKMRLYTRASLLWGGIFFLRLAVQLPIYFAGDSVVALGTVKLVMGYPLFGLGIWATWLMLRKHRAAEAADAPDAPADQPPA